MYDYLIVGAGLTGATAANMLQYARKRCLVIDRRDHIAGNCYDEMLDGIRVHRYGGHIFHTDSQRMWRFVNRFASFQQYEHRVKAYRDGVYYSFPPNKMTEQQLSDRVVTVRRYFYEDFSEKAWGRRWEEIPESIRERVPYRFNWDDRYFTARWQGLPENGYTTLVENLLYQVPVELETDYCHDRDYWRAKADRVIYTGALDELMGYQYGKLEYRSLVFETKRYEQPDYQGCPTVNYPDLDVPYTVINEWKHYGWQSEPAGRTIVTVQTPARFEDTGERYYPYVDEENQERYARYAAALEPGIIPAGRLGTFQYLNMDQAVQAAMDLVEKETS
jgi:UDP-galactopyranose mutase